MPLTTHNQSTAFDLSCVLISPSKVKKTDSSNSICNTNTFPTMVKSPGSSTNSSKSYQFCRICHDGDGSSGSPNSTGSIRESLIAPCKCTGTVALIHLSCLEHWLTASNTDRCEICQFVYKTTRVPRTCNEYIRDRNNQFNIRNLIADIICFLLLTPLLIVSTYLCILGANQYFVKERWEAIGLIILSLFLLGVYFTWCHVTIRYHISVWRSWQRTNQQVRLILINDERYHQLPPTPILNDQNTETSPQRGFTRQIPSRLNHQPRFSHQPNSFFVDVATRMEALPIV